MDIGILGGTFDPIHLGHLAIAGEARKRLNLARVIFIPAGQPWLKANREITKASHRIKMMELALKGKPHFEISTAEVDRPGPSYTIDTLDFLRRKFGTEANFYVIMGWDSLAELPQWHNPTGLVKMCKLVALTRIDGNPPDLTTLEASVPGIKQSTIVLDMKPINISSTEIRKRVARGLPWENTVPVPVARYILKQKLYREA